MIILVPSAKLDSLLQRYLHDRRKLLEFLMSSGLVKELCSASGPSTYLPPLSADYVLDWVNQVRMMTYLRHIKVNIKEGGDLPVVAYAGDLLVW